MNRVNVSARAPRIQDRIASLLASYFGSNS